MPIMAKCQPLHRPSMQSPLTIAAVIIFDVNADKLHSFLKGQQFNPLTLTRIKVLPFKNQALCEYCTHVS